jgi:hypothetical protein
MYFGGMIGVGERTENEWCRVAVEVQLHDFIGSLDG